MLGQIYVFAGHVFVVFIMAPLSLKTCCKRAFLGSILAALSFSSKLYYLVMSDNPLRGTHQGGDMGSFLNGNGASRKNISAPGLCKVNSLRTVAEALSAGIAVYFRRGV